MPALRTPTSSELRRADPASWIATAAAVLALALMALLTIVPDADVAVARLFYTQHNEFVGTGIATVEWLRMAFCTLFVATCVVTAIGLIVTRVTHRTWLGLATARWVYLASCLAMGPGVVANLFLKDHWGRARPNQITQFEGSKQYTSALVRSNECTRNCSFVSGEASSLFIIFFSLAFLIRTRSGPLIAAGVTLGFAAGLVRMLQGAHFLSDVLFAGILMALTAALINSMFEIVADDGKAHASASQACAAEQQKCPFWVTGGADQDPCDEPRRDATK